MVWKLIVIKAMETITPPASKNRYQLSSILYAKDCNHKLLIFHATSMEIAIAMGNITIYDFDSILMISNVLAPRIFRMPISLVLWTVVNSTISMIPRQDIIMASIENIDIGFASRSSFSYAELK